MEATGFGWSFTIVLDHTKAQFSELSFFFRAYSMMRFYTKRFFAKFNGTRIWTAPHLNRNTDFLRGNETVSGKALAAGSPRHSPAASALPLTKVARSN